MNEQLIRLVPTKCHCQIAECFVLAELFAFAESVSAVDKLVADTADSIADMWRDIRCCTVPYVITFLHLVCSNSRWVFRYRYPMNLCNLRL